MSSLFELVGCARLTTGTRVMCSVECKKLPQHVTVANELFKNKNKFSCYDDEERSTISYFE